MRLRGHDTRSVALLGSMPFAELPLEEVEGLQHRGEWIRYSSRMRDELLIQLLSYGKGPGTHTAGTLLQALFRLLEVLVPGTWKDGLPG